MTDHGFIPTGKDIKTNGDLVNEVAENIYMIKLSSALECVFLNALSAGWSLEQIRDAILEETISKYKDALAVWKDNQEM